MFTHNLKYAFKILFKNKALIFWTFAFPLILATFFNMAFSNLEASEKLDIINIAIVNDNEFKENEIFKTAFKNLSDKNSENRIFETTYTTYEEANKLLENDEIIGYLRLENGDAKITLATSGISQTIFKYVSEEISETNDIIKNLTEEKIKKEMISDNYNIDYQGIYKEALKTIETSNAKLTDISNSNLDYSMIEFYTLIAMACMYGGILGLVSINQNLANMSAKGKRVTVAPTKKFIIILSSLLASYITQLIGLSLLFIYTKFVLNVDYGDNIWLVILLAIVGSFAGLSLGTCIGTTIKSNENTKTGILIAVTMFGCFLSGMFGITMKYIVDKYCTIANKLNPVNMITDGLYALYYYDTLNRYCFNIISLLIFAFVLILISFILLRRQKYDSI